MKEYLEGGVSLRELGRKYEINYRTIHRWLKTYQSGEGLDGKHRRIEEMSAMPRDVGRLQRELYEARLQAKLYKTVIDIAEKEMGIPILKKPGVKRSR